MKFELIFLIVSCLLKSVASGNGLINITSVNTDIDEEYYGYGCFFIAAIVGFVFFLYIEDIVFSCTILKKYQNEAETLVGKVTGAERVTETEQLGGSAGPVSYSKSKEKVTDRIMNVEYIQTILGETKTIRKSFKHLSKKSFERPSEVGEVLLYILPSKGPFSAYPRDEFHPSANHRIKKHSGYILCSAIFLASLVAVIILSKDSSESSSLPIPSEVSVGSSSIPTVVLATIVAIIIQILLVSIHFYLFVKYLYYGGKILRTLVPSNEEETEFTYDTENPRPSLNRVKSTNKSQMHSSPCAVQKAPVKDIEKVEESAQEMEEEIPVADVLEVSKF